VPPDVDERPLDIGQFAVLGDPVPKMRVICRPERLQVPSCFDGDMFAVHDRGIGKRTHDIPELTYLGIRFEKLHNLLTTLIGKQTYPRSYCRHIGVFFQILDFCADSVGQHKVVLIQAADIFAFCFGKCKIQHTGQPPVLGELVKPHPLILLLEIAANFTAMVRAAVIDQQYLKVLVLAFEHA